MKEYILTWSIKNISSSWHETGKQIVSPTFHANSMYNTAWTMVLYPRGKVNDDYLTLQLHRDDSLSPAHLKVNVEFSCITAHTSILHRFCVNCTNFDNSGYSRFIVPCFIPRSEVFGRRKTLYLPNDVLTLRCRIWKDDGDSNEFDQNFGLTQLVIEKMVFVEYIYLQNSIKETIRISKPDKLSMSISLLPYCDTIEVGINNIDTKYMKFSTLKLSLVNEWTPKKVWEHEFYFFGRPNDDVWRLSFSDQVLLVENEKSDRSNCKFVTEFVYASGEEKKIIENDCPPQTSEFLWNYIICVENKEQTFPFNLSDDLRNLLDEQVLCDVELKVEKQSFFAHRVVLSARSQVFLAMLMADTKEKKYGCIEIEDVSAEVLWKFIVYLYSDRIEFPADRNLVIELYYVADKYQVKGLKLLCSVNLLKNLSIDNVCELLMLTDRHTDCELERSVNAVIWKHDELVFKSSTWKNFADENKHLAMKTMLSRYEEKGNAHPLEKYEEWIANHAKLEDDFRSLYEGRNVSDIVIKTTSASYLAYKVILCASSLVFKDMLNDLRYKSSDFIEIVDLDNETVHRMVYFLHTNLLEDIQWNTVMKLYHAAVVYKIFRLKYKCSCYLVENLRVYNACELLRLAHEHSDVELKTVVEDYICVYDEEVFGSGEWADFCKTNTSLALDTMCAKYRSN